ncbi:MAG TPA: hypothetical protein VHB21_04355, partial [Minicystis sp.]|nr:hypothetical protein [Minicystis sp.]
RAAELGVASRLPPGFDAWFAGCVARPPTQRFVDGAHAAAALDAVLAAASLPPSSARRDAAGASASGARAGATPGAFTPSPTPYPAHMPAPPRVPSWASDGPTGASAPVAVTGPSPLARPRDGTGKLIAIAVGACALFGALLLVGVVAIGALASRDARPEPRETTAADLAGSWSIASSMRPGNGGAYAGTVALTRVDDAYRVTWVLTRGAGYEGIGLVDGRSLAVGWSNMSGYVLAVYHAEGGRLHGRLVAHDGRSLGTEELEGPAGFGGAYTLARASSGATGRVTITPRGDVYLVSWATSRGAMSGIGLRTREGLVVGAMPAGHQAGVVAYEVVSPHRLSGRWAVMGDPRVGTEVLVRK